MDVLKRLFLEVPMNIFINFKRVVVHQDKQLKEVISCLMEEYVKNFYGGKK